MFNRPDGKGARLIDWEQVQTVLPHSVDGKRSRGGMILKKYAKKKKKGSVR